MAISRLGRTAVAVAGLAALAGSVIWFGILKREDAPGQRKEAAPRVPTEAPASSQPAETAPTAPPPEGQVERVPDAPAAPSTTAPTAPLSSAPPAPAEAAPATPARPSATPPTFDVVRVEPSGESVIAGRTAPGATVELLRNGKSHARIAADDSGLFAFVPPPFPPGSHEVVLQSIAPDGTRTQSRESLTIAIPEKKDTKPLVALTTPDRPTVVISEPEAAGPGRPPASPEFADPHGGSAGGDEGRAGAALCGAALCSGSRALASSSRSGREPASAGERCTAVRAFTPGRRPRALRCRAGRSPSGDRVGAAAARQCAYRERRSGGGGPAIRLGPGGTRRNRQALSQRDHDRPGRSRHRRSRVLRDRPRRTARQLPRSPRRRRSGLGRGEVARRGRVPGSAAGHGRAAAGGSALVAAGRRTRAGGIRAPTSFEPATAPGASAGGLSVRAFRQCRRAASGFDGAVACARSRGSFAASAGYCRRSSAAACDRRAASGRAAEPVDAHRCRSGERPSSAIAATGARPRHRAGPGGQHGNRQPRRQSMAH